MKLEITSETVALSVYISWKVAGEADTHERWLHAWDAVENQLHGMWSLVSWAAQYQERAEAIILMEEINLLRSVANEIRFSWREK